MSRVAAALAGRSAVAVQIATGPPAVQIATGLAAADPTAGPTGSAVSLAGAGEAIR